jgi:hypothetical protein
MVICTKSLVTPAGYAPAGISVPPPVNALSFQLFSALPYMVSNIVAFIEQGHFVAHLLELQRDDVRACLCWHLVFSLELL